MANLSILIVNWNTCDLLRDCLSMLSEAALVSSEIFVIDNASTDDSVSMLKREFPSVCIIENQENAGFARANNQGIRNSHGEYVLLLNSDTLVPKGTIPALLAYMDKNPKVGAISPRLVDTGGQAQQFAFGSDPTSAYLLRRAFSALLFHKPLHHWATSEVAEVDWISGACMLIRRSAIEQAGTLDEAMFMYFEDNEWCLRMRQKGWKIVYYPAVSITHIGGQSLKQNPKAQKAYYASLRYFYRKHYSWLANLWLSLFLPIYQRLK